MNLTISPAGQPLDPACLVNWRGNFGGGSKRRRQQTSIRIGGIMNNEQPYVPVTAEDTLAKLFADKQIDFVPDPMVLRAAELFLLGRSGVPNAGMGQDVDPESVWSVIDRNIDGLLAFFHLFMTRERIPLIDYEHTFPSQQFTQLLGNLVYPIHPDRGIYEEAKQDAQRKLINLQFDTLPLAMIADIRNELGTAGYEWYPDLGADLDLAQDQEVVARFVMGGIIFGAYAQVTGTDHVLQTKRSRLFAALSVPQAIEPLWGIKKEQELFARLREYTTKDARFAAEDIDLPPSVVPYLLVANNPPKTPAQLLERALQIRNSDTGEDYRTWHTRLRAAWSLGRHDFKAEEDVHKVRRELEKRFGNEGERARSAPQKLTCRWKWAPGSGEKACLSRRTPA
ncbi:MAG TPA: hypothetical protein VIM41_13915 [Gammaproteobacteria bacterium]